MAESRGGAVAGALILIAGLSASVILFPCGAGAATADGQRIVSLAPSVTETLFALGAGPQVVGVSTYCDFPPAARKLPKVGSFLTPNVEEIVALRPTLVVGLESSANQREIRALQMMGYPTLMVGEDSLAEIQQSILRIGARIGRSEAAQRLAAGLRRNFDSLQTRLGKADSPKVLMLVGHQPLVAVGSRTFLGQLISMAHAVNIADRAGQAWPRLSIEYVIASAPDVIIDGQMGGEAAPAENFWRQYPTIPAVRNHRVYGYDQDPMLRPGPRVWQSLEILASFIHPELAPAPGGPATGAAERAGREAALARSR